MSTVNSSKITASATRTTPPWRRGRVAANEAADADVKTASALLPKLEIEDNASTTTGSSDSEDASTRTRTDSETTNDTSTPYIPPWRRGGRMNVDETVTDDNKSISDDDASLTTACSDDDDACSMSQSEVEVTHVISRNALLIHRERYLSVARTEDRSAGLHCRHVVKTTPTTPDRTAKATPTTPDRTAQPWRSGLTAKASPPGLAAKASQSAPPGCVLPPGLAMFNGAALAIPDYTPPTFRKELMAILKDLAMDRNVARAVRRIRLQKVPRERQAAEYADTITFVLEEHRGAARRSSVALLAGLAYGVFERKQCIAGLDIFFLDVYLDLQEEVPKLNKMVLTELLPTLASVFAAEELSAYEALVKL